MRTGKNEPFSKSYAEFCRQFLIEKVVTHIMALDDEARNEISRRLEKLFPYDKRGWMFIRK